MPRHAPTLVVVLAIACGPKVDIDDGDGDGSADDGSDDAADDDADTPPDASDGDGPLDTPTFLAWLDEEGRLHVSVANHATPTCDDRDAFPEGGLDDCEKDDPRIWTVTLTLDPPQSIPGTWDVGSYDMPSPLGSFMTSKGPGCQFGVGSGIDATLSLEPAPQSNVAGTVSIDAYATGVVPFLVPLCE